ncbi:MAG: hypothetical protein KY467_14240 [Gemmatimonadetes bacterium]|nr:hypothetical protein [Gemmatimonadota bacterium]
MILKDSCVRGLAAAGALLIAAACGGDDEPQAAAAANDTAAAAPVASAPVALDSAYQPPAPAPHSAAVLDSGMSPARAAEVAAAAPPPEGPVSLEALKNYRLTLPRLRTLVQAGQNIAALQARRPELRDSMRIPTMDPNLLYQKLNGIPAVREAVTRAGMTPREYALATAALIQATMVHELRRRGENPQGEFNEANVQFVTENMDEIQSIMRSAGAATPGQRPN